MADDSLQVGQRTKSWLPGKVYSCFFFFSFCQEKKPHQLAEVTAIPLYAGLPCFPAPTTLKKPVHT